MSASSWDADDGHDHEQDGHDERRDEQQLNQEADESGLERLGRRPVTNALSCSRPKRKTSDARKHRMVRRTIVEISVNNDGRFGRTGRSRSPAARAVARDSAESENRPSQSH